MRKRRGTFLSPKRFASPGSETRVVKAARTKNKEGENKMQEIKISKIKIDISFFTLCLSSFMSKVFLPFFSLLFALMGTCTLSYVHRSFRFADPFSFFSTSLRLVQGVIRITARVKQRLRLLITSIHWHVHKIPWSCFERLLRRP